MPFLEECLLLETGNLNSTRFRRENGLLAPLLACLFTDCTFDNIEM